MALSVTVRDRVDEGSASPYEPQSGWLAAVNDPLCVFWAPKFMQCGVAELLAAMNTRPVHPAPPTLTPWV